MKFIISLLSTPAVLLGVVACIGLILQKKSVTEIFTGASKTLIGFLVFGIGASAMTGSLQNFNKLFQYGFGITGVIASPEAATALAQSTYGFEVSLTLILGFILNLVFARITRFKNIFFTTGHSLFFSCVLVLIMQAHGFSSTVTILVAATILGFMSAALPQFCQPFMRDMTGGDEQAIGHFNMIGYGLSGYLGRIFSKHKEETTESIEFPKWLSIFRDFLMGLSIVMLLLFYVATIKAGQTFTQELAGSQHWLVFPLVQAFTFVAGMSILMTGVRMFLAEITAAFVVISEKYIPGSRPALDVPTVFPYAPNAVILGFISAYTAGLLAIVVMVSFPSVFPVVIIPAAHICFFSGGTAAVFGNSSGGWRGALLGSFVAGLLLAFLPTILYPVYGTLGIEGATFPNIDYNVVGTTLHKILQLIKPI
ncbi:Ascorbate-specific permease IIC component UlaA [compost metagenome]|jgi:PTS system ascorbate-specific IIC component|uniref:Ascorbate-specific PTS system EIIC component n=1 Tax=Clostridium intestinale DSM 6191 TaxID=1121320 RepID=A0A1M5UC05_9CLOT|nr:PTS ascorbate transporter subunit IIC [Clostridium intestinale]WRY52901.1 PTS transporter subunit IIC [Clostridium intestinale]SHH60497.1 PTS system, ascorbate-specific IIC component [Clostridium intestinale DSM 6191]